MGPVIRVPLLAVLLLMGSAPVYADVTRITNESGLATPVTVPWGNLGASGTQLTNPFSLAVPDTDTRVEISAPAGDDIVRFDNGGQFLGLPMWEQLLIVYNWDTEWPTVTLRFSEPVAEPERASHSMADSG